MSTPFDAAAFHMLDTITSNDNDPATAENALSIRFSASVASNATRQLAVSRTPQGFVQFRQAQGSETHSRVDCTIYSVGPSDIQEVDAGYDVISAERTATESRVDVPACEQCYLQHRFSGNGLSPREYIACHPARGIPVQCHRGAATILLGEWNIP